MSFLKIVFALSMLMLFSGTYGGDWLCWGGNPGRTNFSPDTIIDPSADDFDLIWRDSVHAPGKVGGCPIIANGRVYVRDYMYHVCAYDLLTGEFLWRSPQLVNNPSKHVYGENNNGLCYGDGCLVYQTYKTIGCLDAITGEIKWKLEEMSRQSHKQYSPIIYKGIVYGSYVDNDRTKTVYFARNVQDGSVVWEYVLDGYSWGGTAVSPPAPPIDTANGIIYGSTCKKIGSEMSYPLFGKTFALNLNTGTLIWENNTVYSDYRNYGHLALHKGLLYLVTLNYGCDRPDTIGDTIVYSRCDMYSILDAATGNIIKGPGEHDIGGTGTRSIALWDTVLITGRAYSHAFWICNLMGKALANTEKAAGYLPEQGDGMSGCGTPVIANGYVFKANGQYELNGQLTAVKISNVLTMAPRDTMVSWAYRIYGSCAEPVIGDGFMAFASKQGYLNVFANRNKLPGGTQASAGIVNNWNKRLSVFPNPFNPVTSLSFVATSKSHAELKVFNPKGELVKTILSGVVDAGRHNVAWDATAVASGIYVAKLSYGGKVSTVKLVVSK